MPYARCARKRLGRASARASAKRGVGEGVIGKKGVGESLSSGDALGQRPSAAPHQVAAALGGTPYAACFAPFSPTVPSAISRRRFLASIGVTGIFTSRTPFLIVAFARSILTPSGSGIDR